MNHPINLFAINLLLAVGWAAITGTFWWLNLLFGFAVAFAALWIAKPLYHDQSYFTRFGTMLDLIWTFLKDLVLSSVTVARQVLSIRQQLRPGIIALPLDCQQDFQITIFANMITLTPGTLSLDVDEDRKTLYIHAMDIEDAEALKRDLKQSFEAKVMEATQ